MTPPPSVAAEWFFFFVVYCSVAFGFTCLLDVSFYSVYLANGILKQVGVTFNRTQYNCNESGDDCVEMDPSEAFLYYDYHTAVEGSNRAWQNDNVLTVFAFVVGAIASFILFAAMFFTALEAVVLWVSPNTAVDGIIATTSEDLETGGDGGGGGCGERDEKPGIAKRLLSQISVCLPKRSDINTAGLLLVQGCQCRRSRAGAPNHKVLHIGDIGIPHSLFLVKEIKVVCV